MLSGAPYLSGLKAENMQLIQDTAAERFAPEQFRAHRDALRGLDRLANSRQLFERGIMLRLQRWKAAANKTASVENAFA